MTPEQPVKPTSAVSATKESPAAPDHSATPIADSEDDQTAPNAEGGKSLTDDEFEALGIEDKDSGGSLTEETIVIDNTLGTLLEQPEEEQQGREQHDQADVTSDADKDNKV